MKTTFSFKFFFWPIQITPIINHKWQRKILFNLGGLTHNPRVDSNPKVLKKLVTKSFFSSHLFNDTFEYFFNVTIERRRSLKNPQKTITKLFISTKMKIKKMMMKKTAAKLWLLFFQSSVKVKMRILKSSFSQIMSMKMKTCHKFVIRFVKYTHKKTNLICF